MRKPSEIRIHSLFCPGDSYVDTPIKTEFLHLSRTEGKLQLHCLVDPNTRITWRHIKVLPSVDQFKLSDDFEFIGAADGRDGLSYMAFLNPLHFDADCKPLEL